jgi:hypothetical protein
MVRVSGNEDRGGLGDVIGGGQLSGTRQELSVSDAAKAAVLGSGVQNVYLGGRQPEPTVSIAPPFGLRPEGLPVRGREGLLADLEAAGPRVRVLCGLGGCGKTRLALEIAARAAERGARVWWVPAGDGEVLRAGMRALGRRLGATDAQLEHGDAADIVWQRLAEQDRSWLLVLDNADDPRVLAAGRAHIGDGVGWLRPVRGDMGMVLVTSRDGSAASWGRWCARHRVGTLPAEAATVMLADYIGSDEAGSAKDRQLLAGRLGGLPLAVKIVGSYLADAVRVPAEFARAGAVRTCRQYLEVLEGGGLAAVFPVPGEEMTQEQARGLIGRTWELTLDLLDARHLPEARTVLRLLASFAALPVPYQLLDPDTLARSAVLAGITGARLWETLTALDDHGLIDLAVGGQGPGGLAVARLHPLVRDTSRPPAGSPERLAFLKLTARLLQRASRSDQMWLPEDPLVWPMWQLVVSHAAAVFRSLAADPRCPDADAEMGAAAFAALMLMRARYLAGQGMHTQAERQYRNVLAETLRVLGLDHPFTLAARHGIAVEMAEQGDRASAEIHFRGVLAARLRVLGRNHPDTRVTAGWVDYLKRQHSP